MKSLKSLLAISLAMAISSTVLAETNHATQTVKESVATQVTTMKNDAQAAVKNVQESAAKKVVDVKTAADSKATATKEMANSVKANTSSKMADVKSSAVSKVAATKDAVAKKVNVNTANAKTLQTLSGIGATKAKAIIDYRKKFGKFTSAEDLAKVSGIGEATVEALKPFISF